MSLYGSVHEVKQLTSRIRPIPDGKTVATLRPEYTERFRDSNVCILEMQQPEHAGHEIEACVLVWQILRISLLKRQMWIVLSGFCDHVAGKIQPFGNCSSGLGHSNEVTSAGADVEQPFAAEVVAQGIEQRIYPLAGNSSQPVVVGICPLGPTSVFNFLKRLVFAVTHSVADAIV